MTVVRGPCGPEKTEDLWRNDLLTGRDQRRLRGMKSRNLLYTGLAILVAVVALIGWRVRSEKTATVSNPSASAVPAGQKAAGKGGGAPLPVYIHQVVARTLDERITATGMLVADESVELVSELTGKAVEIAFAEGSRVKAGDLLLKLDDTDLKAELARAESRIGLARRQAERQAALVSTGGTSRENEDLATSEVRVREAEMALIKAQLAKAEIRAPFDGIIGLRYLSAGAFVTPATRIATLQKIDKLKVEFAVAERHLERVQRDADVMITIAGMSEPVPGKVYAIEPRIDSATRTLRLRARVDNPGGKALPGGFATVEMSLQKIPDALLVPATALVAGLNEQRVFVLVNGKAEPRTVRIGLRLPREVQIVSGLEPNAAVITSGQLQLRPGMPVKAVARQSDESRGRAADSDSTTPVARPKAAAVTSTVAP